MNPSIADNSIADNSAADNSAPDNSADVPLRLDRYRADLARVDPLRWRGVVTDVTGLVIESQGPASAIGGFCEIQTARGRRVRTQVAGFRNGRILSIPLEEIDGLEPGDAIYARAEDARVDVGPDLLG